jgi:hypothetical protein
MADEKKKTGPPQPILIQAGEGPEPNAVKTDEQSTAPVTAKVNKIRGGPQEAIEQYRLTLSTKPSIVGESVLGFLLVVAVPFFLVFSVLESGDDGPLTLCCFSIIAGLVLLAVASTKDNAWRKELKLAKERVLEEVGLKAPPVSKTPHVVFGVAIFVSVLAPSFPFSYSDVVAGLSFMVALVAALVYVNNDYEAKKVLERNLQLVLKQSDEEE